MSTSQNFLDGLGVEQLVEYIKNQLNTKLGATEANNLYALKDDLNSLLTSESLDNYATKEYVDESRYNDNDLQTKIQQIESRISNVFCFKGNVDTFNILNQINERSIGDVYHIEDSNKNYTWSGFEWIDAGSIFNLTLDDYLTKTEIENTYVKNNQLEDYLTKNEIENIYVKNTQLENYLTQDNAENIYVKNNELNNYLTKNEIENIYVKNDQLNDYLTLANAENTYVQNIQLNDYLTQNDAENIYTKNNEIDNLIRSTIYSILSPAPVNICNSNEEIQNALNSTSNEVTIVVNEDANLSNVNINNKKVTLDLGGKNLTTSTIVTVNNNSDLTLTNGTLNNSSYSVLAVTSGSKATLNNVNADSGNFCLLATDGEITINSGYIQAQEGGVLGAKNSVVTLNNGKIECRDNCPFQGDGSAAGTNNDGTNAKFYLNDGSLIAHIQTPGYQACGAYIPNSGEFIMTGGRIISDGAGLVMRDGKVSLLGGEIICNIKTATNLTDGKGKVGNSSVVISAVPIVYDAQANYPGLTYQDFELIIDMNKMIFRKGDGSGSLENLITLTDPEEIVTQLLGPNDEVTITNEDGIYHIFMEQK